MSKSAKRNAIQKALDKLATDARLIERDIAGLLAKATQHNLRTDISHDDPFERDLVNLIIDHSVEVRKCLVAALENLDRLQKTTQRLNGNKPRSRRETT